MTTNADSVGRALAAWLLPYILDAMRTSARETSADNSPQSVPGGSGTVLYTTAQCDAFVAGLKLSLLRRMRTMFALLKDRQTISSRMLLENVPDAKTTSGLAAALTNHVKRRAKSMKLPYPWRITKDLQGRVSWTDDGVTASALLDAIDRELERRREEG